MFTSIKDFILKDIVLEIKDLKSLQYLKNLHQNYLPWSGASVRPTALVYILNEIMVNERKTIVECGAGISTIYIACLLKQMKQTDRRLFTIDHDANWLSVVRSQLDEHDLLTHVTLIHAPLKYCEECQDESQLWYDTDAIRKEIGESKIDLLFVDGPPANKPGIEQARYPAVPFFKKNLSDSVAILLDDATRKGERKIAKKWSNELDRPFEKSVLSGNMYICKRGVAYNVM